MDLTDFQKIPNYSRYLVSPNGEFYDLKKNRPLKWLNYTGKMVVADVLNDQGEKHQLQVRRIVYKVFVNNNLPDGAILESKDGNMYNNHFSNIRLKPRKINGFGYMELAINGSKSRDFKKLARSIWLSMMDRCYNKNSDAFTTYGGSGVIVCDEWHDFNTFCDWFIKNYIPGFSLDKDFINDGNKQYCPDKCAFIPRGLNSLIVKWGIPTIERYRRGTYALATTIACNQIIFKGDTQEECIEQYVLARKLQLEKLIWLTLNYHKNLKCGALYVPDIDGRVISKLVSMVEGNNHWNIKE